MKLAINRTIGLLIVSAVSGCTAPGDFCEVVRGPIKFQRETAAQILVTDRAAAEAVKNQNDYGFLVCADW